MLGSTFLTTVIFSPNNSSRLDGCGAHQDPSQTQGSVVSIDLKPMAMFLGMLRRGPLTTFLFIKACVCSITID